MIKAFILTAAMNGGLILTPMVSAEACASALAGLHPSLAYDAECVEVEMAPGTIYAPPASPIPPRKPKRVAP